MGRDDDISELIAKLVLKDRTAFDQLYDLTSSKLFAICLRLMGERSQAEDAMQDVYVKIWNKANRYRPGNASAMGWLCAITRNHCIDLIRARKPIAKPIDQAFEIKDKAASPEQAAMTAADRTRIEACMSELDPDKAQAVKAAYVEGYSYAELAEYYKVPLNTMRTWLRRSLQNLRKCLDR